MFKICNDKTYYVVQTTSEDVVVEIYTKKDGRGSGISLHEMHLDLCRAIRKLQHDGYTIMKVSAEGNNAASMVKKLFAR